MFESFSNREKAKGISNAEAIEHAIAFAGEVAHGWVNKNIEAVSERKVLLARLLWDARLNLGQALAISRWVIKHYEGRELARNKELVAESYGVAADVLYKRGKLSDALQISISDYP